MTETTSNQYLRGFWTVKKNSTRKVWSKLNQSINHKTLDKTHLFPLHNAEKPSYAQLPY